MPKFVQTAKVLAICQLTEEPTKDEVVAPTPQGQPTQTSATLTECKCTLPLICYLFCIHNPWASYKPRTSFRMTQVFSLLFTHLLKSNTTHIKPKIQRTGRHLPFFCIHIFRFTNETECSGTYHSEQMQTIFSIVVTQITQHNNCFHRVYILLGISNLEVI